jgi:stage III sporulation protein AG
LKKDSDNKFDWQAKIKEIGPMKLTVLVAVGALLLLLTYGDFLGSSEEKDSKQENIQGEETTISDEEYRVRMENRVKELLKRVDGVGNAEVMITLSASREKVALKDNETGESKSQEESVIVNDSDRNSSPYIIQEKEPVPEGILVVCEGGGNAKLSREIINAIQVLFNVEAHKIKVMKMEP